MRMSVITSFKCALKSCPSSETSFRSFHLLAEFEAPDDVWIATLFVVPQEP